VLEMLGEVYRYDAEARDGAPTAERLRFHQEQSGPVMEKLYGWLAGGAVRRAEDRAQLRFGQGDHLSVAALESLNDVPPRSRSPIRQ
jgi:hypothetical protein